MLNFDASTAEVLVFTFKDGLLSPMAHDLKIRVHRFTVEVEGDAISATFEADSLKVESVRKDGADAHSLMPDAAFTEIEKNIKGDVLNAWRHPRIRFKSTALTETTVEGTLTLCSVSKPITGRRADDATHHIATFEIDQRDFGIRPYTAMLGTLKVKPLVTVTVRIPRVA
jgi:polyisoprenoid-binding protein YceI